MISCCSKYRMCSKQGFCINSAHKKECSYARKLEDGHNFYDSDHLNRLYILVNGSCYAISRRNRADVLFEPDEQSKELLKQELKKLGIDYLEQYEFRFCNAERTSDVNPAYWEVGFTLGDNAYLIRNFNIRLMTEARAKELHEYLYAKGLNCSIYTRADSKMLSNMRVAKSNIKSKSLVHVKSDEPKKPIIIKPTKPVKKNKKPNKPQPIVEPIIAEQIDMFWLMADMGS